MRTGDKLYCVKEILKNKKTGKYYSSYSLDVDKLENATQLTNNQWIWEDEEYIRVHYNEELKYIRKNKLEKLKFYQ